MSQNQEIIESKLCAYIDGELDADGRAEIEKHLEANPQHRRLLESLRATRDLLRWLPREPAPPEISETLNGQLERSVLLDYSGDSLRPSIWPRVFATAAIIVLTAGLGAAVYYALPKSQKPAQLAIHTPSNNENELKLSSPEPAAPAVPRSGEAETDHAAEKASPPAPVAADGSREIERAKDGMAEDRKGLAFKPTASPEDAAKKTAGEPAVASSNSSELDALAKQVAENPTAFSLSFPEELGRQNLPGNMAANTTAGNTPGNATTNALGADALAAHASAGNTYTGQTTPAPVANALVMLVRSDTPEQAEKELTAYFAAQQIQWRQTQLADGAMPQPSQGTIQTQAPTTQNSVQQLRADAERFASAKQDVQRSARDLSKSAAASEQTNLRDGPFWNGSRAETQPAQKASMAGKAAGFGQSPPAAPVQAPTPQLGDNSLRGNGLYVCQMSRRQAVQLTNTISRDGNQAAEVKDVTGLTYATPGTAGSLTRNGGEQQLAQNALPQRGLNDPSATNYFGDLPRDRSVRSRGAETDPLKREVAIAPSGSLDRAAATQPAGSVGSASAPLSSSSGGTANARDFKQQAAPAMAAPLPASAPSTQPAEPPPPAATAPADEPLNVVILVQANTIAPSQTQPAAQPHQASAPASTQPSQPNR